MPDEFREVLTPDTYYGLRIISMLCKSITVISTLVGLGLTGAILARLLNVSPRLNFSTLFQMWLNEAVIVLIIVGGIGFMFFIVSQLLDVQIAINNKVNVIASVLKSMDKMVDRLELQDEQELPETMTKSQHQQIMQALHRQNRMLSKVYQDLLDNKEDSKINIKVD